MERLFLLVGASGSGKTTLGEHLKKIGFNELVSHTTRPVREGEIHGVHYYFCNDDEFNAEEMIERSSYPSEGGVFQYGTSRKEVANKLKSGYVFGVVDFVGAKALKKAFSEATVIQLIVSEKEMRERLKKRGDSSANIEARVNKAKENQEFLLQEWADYKIESYSKEATKDLMYEILHNEEFSELA